MRTTTVRELRTNFPKVERWVADGEEVQITKRRKVVATLVPPPRREPLPVELPDFAGRVRTLFAKRKLTRKQSTHLRQALRGER